MKRTAHRRSFFQRLEHTGYRRRRRGLPSGRVPSQIYSCFPAALSRESDPRNTEG